MRPSVCAMAVLILFSGCGDDSAMPEDRLIPYQLSVDRIEVPATVAADDSLRVRLHGYIGQDSRSWFDHMQVQESPSLYAMTAWGIRDETPGRSAVLVVTQWYGAEFVKAPPHADPVSVVFHQPDGTTIEHTVGVVP